MGLVHKAVKAGDLQRLQELVTAAADTKALVNELDEQGYSALFYAVDLKPGQPDVVRALLEAGADPNFVHVERIPGLPADLYDELANKDAAKEFGFDFGPSDFEEKENRSPLLRNALKAGDLEVVKLLHAHGADLAYRDEHGYTAILDAIYGGEERIPLIEFLISLGLDVNAATSYTESPVREAARFRLYETLQVLIDAGADISILKWTPLHRAVALGTLEEVKSQLQSSPKLTAFDYWRQTPLHLAIVKGDQQLVELLLASGASLTQKAKDGTECLCFAVESGNVPLVRWLVAQGCPVESRGFMGATALSLAVQRGDKAMVEALLELGADPNAGDEFHKVLQYAEDREMQLTLIKGGADVSNIDISGVGTFLGFTEGDRDALESVSEAEYLAARYPREGTANPEDMTNPYYLAMIRAGCTAYRARNRFDDEATFACGLRGRQPSPVWCFSRFGQSITMLSDGRIILIAGEHEDSYDPDFCIYNDVAVFHPDGEIRVYGYPYNVFPPTDFHTATLVGDYIYIIGSLGYMDQRKRKLPVYRLDTRDYRMEAIEAHGADPGRIYRHKAKLLEDGVTIRVEGGTRITFRFKEKHSSNKQILDFNTATGVWSQSK